MLFQKKKNFFFKQYFLHFIDNICNLLMACCIDGLSLFTKNYFLEIYDYMYMRLQVYIYIFAHSLFIVVLWHFVIALHGISLRVRTCCTRRD